MKSNPLYQSLLKKVPRISRTSARRAVIAQTPARDSALPGESLSTRDGLSEDQTLGLPHSDGSSGGPAFSGGQEPPLERPAEGSSNTLRSHALEGLPNEVSETQEGGSVPPTAVASAGTSDPENTVGPSGSSSLSQSNPTVKVVFYDAIIQELGNCREQIFSFGEQQNITQAGEIKDSLAQVQSAVRELSQTLGSLLAASGVGVLENARNPQISQIVLGQRPAGPSLDPRPIDQNAIANTSSQTPIHGCAGDEIQLDDNPPGDQQHEQSQQTGIHAGENAGQEPPLEGPPGGNSATLGSHPLDDLPNEVCDDQNETPPLGVVPEVLQSTPRNLEVFLKKGHFLNTERHHFFWGWRFGLGTSTPNAGNFGEFIKNGYFTIKFSNGAELALSSYSAVPGKENGKGEFKAIGFERNGVAFQGESGNVDGLDYKKVEVLLSIARPDFLKKTSSINAGLGAYFLPKQSEFRKFSYYGKLGTDLDSQRVCPRIPGTPIPLPLGVKGELSVQATFPQNKIIETELSPRLNSDVSLLRRGQSIEDFVKKLNSVEKLQYKILDTTQQKQQELLKAVSQLQQESLKNLVQQKKDIVDCVQKANKQTLDLVTKNSSENSDCCKSFHEKLENLRNTNEGKVDKKPDQDFWDQLKNGTEVAYFLLAANEIWLGVFTGIASGIVYLILCRLQYRTRNTNLKLLVRAIRYGIPNSYGAAVVVCLLNILCNLVSNVPLSQKWAILSAGTQVAETQLKKIPGFTNHTLQEWSSIVFWLLTFIYPSSYLFFYFTKTILLCTTLESAFFMSLRLVVSFSIFSCISKFQITWLVQDEDTPSETNFLPKQTQNAEQHISASQAGISFSFTVVAYSDPFSHEFFL